MAKVKRSDRYILVRDDGTTYPDQCHVFGGKRVKWYSYTGPWTIRFGGKTPFSKGKFSIAKGGGESEWTSGAKGDIDEKFKYSVSGNGKAVDPDIIIK